MTWGVLELYGVDWILDWFLTER